MKFKYLIITKKMQCSNCFYPINPLTSIISCPNCGLNFCSTNCLNQHIFSQHCDKSTNISDPEIINKNLIHKSHNSLTNNIKNIDINNINNIKEENKINNNPSFNFLEIVYNPIYDLINFSLIISQDGKP